MQKIVNTMTMNCSSCLLLELFPTCAVGAVGEEPSMAKQVCWLVLPGGVRTCLGVHKQIVYIMCPLTMGKDILGR